MPKQSAVKRPSLKDPVGRVRAVGLVEGVSFLLLLGVAMPLKYLAEIPGAVTWVGWAHGVLFILLMAVLFDAWRRKLVPTGRAALVVIAALLPCGPFLIDRRLARAEAGG